MAEGLLRDGALWEVKQLMAEIPPERLTAYEILAVIAIVRGAKERINNKRTY